MAVRSAARSTTGLRPPVSLALGRWQAARVKASLEDEATEASRERDEGIPLLLLTATQAHVCTRYRRT
jgi:hypothetical protein